MFLIIVMFFSIFYDPIRPAAAEYAYLSVSPHNGQPYDGQKLSTKQRRHKLIQHFRSWQGTPYNYGSLSRRGIDCSGFVYLTFRDVLNMDIPRSTELLSKINRRIRPANLSAGDLVFFHTGPGVRHVGIYIGQRQFIHASKSRGVMLSSLDNPYWFSTYWKAVRVLD